MRPYLPASTNSTSCYISPFISTSRFRSQAHNIIWNVYRYFSAQWGGDSSAEILEKTAKATHVSVKTVRRVQRQASECDPNPITSRMD
ncbi:hypothetical protein Pmani_008651 [Petrolisthes manimaculis]|uniref:Uncharacterized protein n=1 Tax=Petrolisthes manimaculis TaxID=1843537 RepID=A0AAE1Q6H3_9EUCA|nr:hypothetical protein Pmani_008651 [Petrolisthes manimaculis]